MRSARTRSVNVEKFLMDLANSRAFWLGLGLGGAGLVSGWLVAVLWRRVPQPPIGGALFSVATLFVLWSEFEAPWGLLAGCLALVGGVMLGTELWDRALGALPGAIAIVYVGDVGSGASAVVIVLAIAAGSALVVDFDREFRTTGLGLPLLAGSVFGMLMTVPDTERTFGLIGVALPLIFLGWPRPLVSLGSGGAAAVGIVGWVAAFARLGRPGATIGALAALGLMLGEPIGRRIAEPSRSALLRLASAGPVRSLIVVGIHGVLVFGAARVAGLQERAPAAIALSIPFLALGAILGAAPDAAHRAGADDD